jgi:hypothetical protein
LQAIGLVHDEVLGVHVFIEADDPLPSQGIHVIEANEKVRANSLHPAPDVDRVERSSSGFLVLGLAPLITMKLDAFRRVDQVHLEDLFRVGLIDAELARQLPADLVDRLRYVRDTMEWLTEPPVF